MKALLAKITVLTAARMAGALAMFLCTVLIARNYGVDAVAAYATAIATASLCSIVILLGFHALAPVLSADYEAQQDFAKLRGLSHAGFWLIGIGSSILAAIIGLILAFAVPHVSTTWFAALIFAVFAVPPISMLLFCGGVLTGIQKQVAAQLPDSVGRPGLFLSFLIILSALAPTVGIAWILSLAVVALWVVAIVQFILLRKELTERPAQGSDFEWPRWRRQLPSWLTISIVWDYSIDIFLIIAGLLADTPEIALIHVCFRFRVLAGFGMKSIYAVFQPKIYKAVSLGDDTALREAISQTNVLALVYALSAFGLLWLFSNPLLSIFGTTFTDGGTLLVIISATFVIRAIFGPALAVLGISGFHLDIAKVLAACLIIALVAAVPLFSIFGVEGIAIAYTMGNLLASVTLWRLTLVKTKINCAIWTLTYPMIRSRRLHEL